MLRPLDAATVRGAARGDRDAFEALVSAYHRDMVRVAFVILRDAELAADAAQAAWVMAWRKLHTVRDTDKVRSWLLSVAANEAKQLTRRRRSEVGLSALYERLVGPDPIDGLAATINLVDCVAKLSIDDRRLLALKYAGGLTSQEMAGHIGGISAGAVRHRLMRIMSRLREEMNDDRRF